MTGDAEGWHRHPADVARLVAALLVAALLVAAEAADAPRLRRLTDDVVRLVDLLPSGLSSFLVGLLQLAATVAPVVALVGLVLARRWRLLATLAVAALLGATAMAGLSELLADAMAGAVASQQAVDSWFAGAAYPSGSYLAGLTAVVTAAAPTLTRPWRRAAWAGVALVAVIRLVTVTIDPLRLGLLVALGAAAGSAVLVAFGARRRRVDPEVVAETLRRSGIDPVDVQPVGQEVATPTFLVHDRAGGAWRVTVLGRDDRDTDLLLQAVRWFRVRGLGDPRPAGGPAQVARRAALTAALADAGGARVARPRALGRTAEGAMVMAVDHVEGPSLATADEATTSEDVLVDLWRQVGRLHGSGIAHRGLTGRRVVLGPDGPTIVRFRGAELDAPARARDADVAQLLVTTALRVGVPAAVAAAVEALGPAPVARALPLLQPVVLLAPTREELAKQPELLDELRAEARSATGADEVELADVKRIDAKRVVSMLGVTVIGYYLITLASDASAIADSLREVSLALLPWIVLLTVAQTVAGSISLHGSVTERLSLLRTTEIMFAQSILNRFTPANAGGMALRVRYLQKSGVELPVAASAIGLTSVASGVAQVLVFVVFVAWGDSFVAFDEVSLPSRSRVLVVLVGVGVLAGVVLGSTWGRRRLRPWLARSTASAWGNLRELCRRPAKLGMLLGGAVLAKLVSMGAFAVTVHALGVSLPFATIGALYLVATTIGGAVPTPGGVGGVEAALTAALTAVGVEAATAASIVLVFRLINFWLPVLPGIVCLRRVQSQGIA